MQKNLNLSQQADLLLLKSELLVQNALDNVVFSNPDDVELEPGRTKEGLAIRLKIKYHFPQLLEYQANMLLALYWLRQSLVRLLSTSQYCASHRGQSPSKRTARQIEQLFRVMVAEFKALPPALDLSPVQRIILEREFLNIVFPEPAACRSVPEYHPARQYGIAVNP
jgi:hypothetical protein